MSNSTLSNNSAAYDGGAIYVRGFSGNLITGSILSGNSAVRGGAIYDGGALTISGSILGPATVGGIALPGNVASSTWLPAAGGGLYVPSGATVTVKNSSSITGNSAPVGYGADVYNLGVVQKDGTSTIGILNGNPAQPI